MNNTDLLKAYELLEKITVDKVMLKEKLDLGNRDCAKAIKKLEYLEKQIVDVLNNNNIINKDWELCSLSFSRILQHLL